MSGKNAKFIVGAVIILGVLAWLGISGYQESKTYYVTLPELRSLGAEARTMRLRVAGNVLPGSIRRLEGRVLFTVYQDRDQIGVVYTGKEPLPDTLVDEAQAIVTGRYRDNNLFEAEQVQAKCASKYEALPPGAQPAGGKTQGAATSY